MPRPADEVARTILDARFGGLEAGPGGMAAPSDPDSRVEGGTVRLTAFQEEARRRVDGILRGYRGAILADSVGLGKTYVALGLVAREVDAGRRVAVVVPATLRSQWSRPLRRLGDGWTLYTHTALSRGGGRVPELAPSLVVVDEAHRFRNPGTRRYAALARLTWSQPGPRVLLITATPVNNHPRDLLHLLRLFLADDALRDAGVDSLAGAFDRDRPDRSAVRAVVDAVVVRRTRSHVADRFGAAGGVAMGPDSPRFPRRAEPRVVRYHDGSLARLVAGIADLELAPYEMSAGSTTGPRGRRRTTEGGPKRNAGAAALIRLSLLKRLDSSPAAFHASLQRLRHTLATVRDAALAGSVLRPGPAAASTGDGDPLQLLLVEVVADVAPPGFDLAALADSVDRDLARLSRMRALRGHADPKRGALAMLLARIASERVVIFTEYRDTAADLWRALRRTLRTARVDGGGAWLGDRPSGRRAAVERFAPAAHGRPPPRERERVDVLVATDVLAEGLNLQDARHIVSYDLPWNPVRLMQRIGRVDRLGSPHSVVVPYLFVPSAGLDAMLGLRRRLVAKLDGIAVTGGAEDAGPLLGALGSYGTESADSTGLPVPDSTEALRTLWVRSRGSRRASMRPKAAPGSSAPYATAAVGCAATGTLAWVVAVRDGARVRVLEVGADRSVRQATATAVAVLEQALGGSSGATGGPTPPGWLAPGLRRFLSGQTTARMSVPELPRSSPARRLAGYLARALAEAGIGAGPDRVRRAGALLHRLTGPLDPAAALRAKAVLADIRSEEGTAHAAGERADRDEDADPEGRSSLEKAMNRIERVLGDPEAPPGIPAAGRDPDGHVASASEGAVSVQKTIVLAALRIVPEHTGSPVDDGGG